MGNLDLANEWRRFARMDYDSACYLQGFRPLPIEIICFHCQQAVEKTLKAVLVYHGEEVPYIHDTERLLKLAAALEPVLSTLTLQAERVNSFATTTRYPNKMELEERDMNQALQDAKAVVEAVESLWND